jgi:uncharacterized protein HemX
MNVLLVAVGAVAAVLVVVGFLKSLIRLALIGLVALGLAIGGYYYFSAKDELEQRGAEVLEESRKKLDEAKEAVDDFKERTREGAEGYSDMIREQKGK